MTTSHRPTWTPAQGRAKFGGITSRQVSVKDQNGFTQMKYRQIGQSSQEEMRRHDLREELSHREEAHLQEKRKQLSLIEQEEKMVELPPVLMLKNVEENNRFDDDDLDIQESSTGEFDSSDDEEDDELELQRELEKIKAERAAAQEKLEQSHKEEENRSKKESALKGNPLMNMGDDESSSSSKVKRRWNDDVVFRNQAKSEPEAKKRFVNDTIRNDFHRSFLKKYVE